MTNGATWATDDTSPMGLKVADAGILAEMDVTMAGRCTISLMV